MLRRAETKYMYVFKHLEILSLRAPDSTAADDIFICLFFRESKAWHFRWIICSANDSHEMSSLIFSQKNNVKKKKKKCLLQVLLGALRVSTGKLKSWWKSLLVTCFCLKLNTLGLVSSWRHWSIFLMFSRKQGLTFHAKPCFLGKISSVCHLLN